MAIWLNGYIKAIGHGLTGCVLFAFDHLHLSIAHCAIGLPVFLMGHESTPSQWSFLRIRCSEAYGECHWLMNDAFL